MSIMNANQICGDIMSTSSLDELMSEFMDYQKHRTATDARVLECVRIQQAHIAFRGKNRKEDMLELSALFTKIGMTKVGKYGDLGSMWSYCQQAIEWLPYAVRCRINAAKHGLTQESMQCVVHVIGMISASEIESIENLATPLKLFSMFAEYIPREPIQM